MKKITYYFSTLLLVGALALTSCDQKNDDPTPAGNNNSSAEDADAIVVLDQSSDAGEQTEEHTVFTNDASSDVKVQVRALTQSGSTNNEMKRLYIYKEVSGSTNTYQNVSFDGFQTDGSGNKYYAISTDARNNFTYTFTSDVVADETRDSDQYRFYITGNADFSAESNSTVEGSDNANDNLIVGPGKITLLYDTRLRSNVSDARAYSTCNTQNKGAFDLSTFSNVTTSMDNGQIIFGANNSSSGSVDFSGDEDCAGVYDGGFVGQNNTTYVKAGSNFNYSSATHRSLKNEYYRLKNENNANVKTSVSAVTAGDVYIARMRNDDTKFSVIRIKSLNEVTTNATGYTVFDAKRK